MAEKPDSASQNVTPRDAQKGGQGALGKEHPEIALKQDAPQTAEPPLQTMPGSEELTADQIALLCDIEAPRASKLTEDKRREIEPLLARGYLEPRGEAASMGSLGSHFRLTEKATDFLRKRGVGLNEA